MDLVRKERSMGKIEENKNIKQRSKQRSKTKQKLNLLPLKQNQIYLKNKKTGVKFKPSLPEPEMSTSCKK